MPEKEEDQDGQPIIPDGKVQENLPPEPDDKITEEFVKEFDLSDSFIGKPYKSLGKSYSESLKAQSKAGSEVGELRKKNAALEAQLQNATKVAEKKAVRQTVKELGAMPDPLEDYDGWKDWNEKKDQIRDETLLEKVDKLISDKLEPFKNISKQTEQLTVRATVDSIIKSANESLPEGVDSSDIFQELMSEDKEFYGSIAINNPTQFVKIMLNHYKAKNSGLSEEEINKRATLLAQRQLKKKPKLSEQATFDRANNTGGTSSDVKAIVQDLLKEDDNLI